VKHACHAKGIHFIQRDRLGAWDAFSAGLYKDTFDSEAEALAWLEAQS
jgi:hypothetical protein